VVVVVVVVAVAAAVTQPKIQQETKTRCGGGEEVGRRRKRDKGQINFKGGWKKSVNRIAATGISLNCFSFNILRPYCMSTIALVLSFTIIYKWYIYIYIYLFAVRLGFRRHPCQQAEIFMLRH
jgi:hypothetical protein